MQTTGFMTKCDRCSIEIYEAAEERVLYSPSAARRGPPVGWVEIRLRNTDPATYVEPFHLCADCVRQTLLGVRGLVEALDAPAPPPKPLPRDTRS